MLSDLAYLVRTAEEKSLLEGEIELMQKSLFLSKDGAWEESLSKIRHQIAAYITEQLKKNPNREAVLASLSNYNLSLEPLSLRVACEPSDYLIDLIHEWVRANLGDKIILEFVYDTDIIAGAEISFKGKVVDLSFAKKISEAIDASTL